MGHRELELPDDPAGALERLREASHEEKVVVFKLSPACGVSGHAEEEIRRWLAERKGGQRLAVAFVDVIARRELARGLTRELGIGHQSPQALVLEAGALRWHGSHWDITAARLAETVDS